MFTNFFLFPNMESKVGITWKKNKSDDANEDLLTRNSVMKKIRCKSNYQNQMKTH